MGYYKDNGNSGNLIRNFFDRNFDESNSEKFFRNLHNEEVEKNHKIEFYLYLQDIDGFWGRFAFKANDFGDEYQTLNLGKLLEWDNVDFRKAIQLITYFHEATHKKQRDMFVSNRDSNREEPSSYNNLLSLEIFCTAEAKTDNHEQQLVEIDAIHNSIKKYYKHLKAGDIPTTVDTLNAILYACVRYFASINGEKHHTYCPEKFSTKSKALLEQHKKFYSNFSKQYSATWIEKLPQIIRGSDIISDQQKHDLMKVDFDCVAEEIDKMTQEICHIMQDIFNKMIKIYFPSKLIFDYFDADKSQWGDILRSENIVKLSALICDDLHAKVITAAPKILKKQEETILE